jgi:competence protein ComEC
MKSPAVAIAGAFACGIALGLQPAVEKYGQSKLIVGALMCAVAVAFAAGFLFIQRQQVISGGTSSLLAWGLLGFLGAELAEQPRSADHVLTFVAQGQVDLQSPLRWHGRLRDEPSELPWGLSYDVELEGVEWEGNVRRVIGGLRATYPVRPDSGLPVELHAGDRVAILVKARRPPVFKNPGAFDRRGYLEQQKIDLVGTVRAPQLIDKVSSTTPTMESRIARVRARFRHELDLLFPDTPQIAGVLRAMLLGDRSFIDRAEATDFQKTGVFHVLVVAGLHVGALAFALYWIARKLRLPSVWTGILTLTLLMAFVAVVEQRPPVLRAAIMAAIVVVGGFFYRRLDLLNSVGLAAIILLAAHPSVLKDSSFQLTFVALGCIAGLAVPWIETNVQPYIRALREWRNVDRDGAHEPKTAQFRIDMRSAAGWMSTRLPERVERGAGNIFAGSIGLLLRVFELTVVTVILQLGMLPLMARDFHRVTLTGPLVNLAAVPLTGVIVPLGFLTLVVGTIFHVAGRVLAWPLGIITKLMLAVVHWFAMLPQGSYRIPGPPGWLVATFFVLLIVMITGMRGVLGWQRKFVGAVALAWMISAAMMASYPFRPTWSKDSLELAVLDVGQGDSLLVVSPQGKTMLIDGGGMFGGFPGSEEVHGIDPGEDAVSPYLWSRGFKKLDVVMLTHAHQDHLGGLIAVLENFQVGKLWIGREVDSAALRNLEMSARAHRVQIEQKFRGNSFDWDGAKGEFLWPDESAPGTGQTAKNNDSLVLSLKFGKERFLLPGDAEKDAEHDMISENDESLLNTDVLKVGHHGSKNSSTTDFLAAARPRIGILSVGEDNPYGHPNAELLERLEDWNIKIFRTDRDGTVQVLTDGQDLRVRCFLGQSGAGCASSVQDKRLISADAPTHKQDD